MDSGTTLNYFPTPFADAVNAAFIPPAVYSEDDGAYIVDCKAKAPSLGIKISGTTFGINPLDMILLAGTDENGNDVCISGIDDGGDDLAEDVFILGDTFQVGVYLFFIQTALGLRDLTRLRDYSHVPRRSNSLNDWNTGLSYRIMLATPKSIPKE